MGLTITHEIGHFLGLNHPSEKAGLTHDPIPDTPTCTKTNGLPQPRITPLSCQSDTVNNACNTACPIYNPGTATYCPTAAECAFNHVMWYSSKNYSSPANRDGNILSTDSSQIINYSPFVR
jgi:hypothetical protein